MKKTKTLAIVSAMLLSSLLVPSMLPEVKAGSSQHGGTAPDDLVIEWVKMDDYILECKAMGGDIVDIGVKVKNEGSETITENFEVWLFINEVSFLKSKTVDEDLSPGETYRVLFNDEEINRGIGGYTLDAYINNDDDTRGHCDFTVTLFGIGT